MLMFVQVKGYQTEEMEPMGGLSTELVRLFDQLWSELSGTETGFQDAGVRFPCARGGAPHLDSLVRGGSAFSLRVYAALPKCSEAYLCLHEYESIFASPSPF